MIPDRGAITHHRKGNGRRDRRNDGTAGPTGAACHNYPAGLFEAGHTEAFKELILRRETRPVEKDAYLVREVEKSEIPDGSFVEIEVIK